MAVVARAERTPWATVVAAVVAVLAAANVLTNRVLPGWIYIPWNVAVAVAIVVLARRVIALPTMGLGEWRRGALWGVSLFTITLVLLLVAVAMPAFHDLYQDRRVDGDTATWVYHAFIRIPLGTALLEEVAFRGVLPALFAVRWGVLRGSVAASVLFGVWHVLPAINLNEDNEAVAKIFGHGPAGTVATVVFGVAGTTLAGLWWCWIRYRAHSVLATILAHIATNSIAYTIAFVISG
ncbi:MAG: CPBP family intramembrane metalloprotease [Acidimicrobiaceae bacterium]|nr:CPBP family intramembrane metalloprotease [Acidimicrobiaceae bacterium]